MCWTHENAKLSILSVSLIDIRNKNFGCQYPLIGENVLYVDTDSCVYVSKPGGPQPALGDFLGDLTNEITPKHGPEAYITQFVCGGPKNYAYKVSDGN